MQERAYLKEEIEQSINQEPRISARIDVEVDGRRVRLTGVVETFEEIELAEKIARKLAPIELDNDIVIGPPKNIVEDQDVLVLAKRKVAGDPDLAHDIGIDRIVDGVAYLKGHSENIAKIEAAADLVAEVPGVKDVVSEVKITPAVSVTEEDLVSGVSQALRAEPTIHEEFIGVTAKDGTVTIQGTVTNLEQKTLAAQIAKRLPGAAKVVNNLRVGQVPTSLDAAIENEVISALGMSDINMANVSVNVLDGVVFLDGTVDTFKQKDKARKIVEAIPGVRYVQNDLVMGFHIEPKAKRAK